MRTYVRTAADTQVRLLPKQLSKLFTKFGPATRRWSPFVARTPGEDWSLPRPRGVTLQAYEIYSLRRSKQQVNFFYLFRYWKTFARLVYFYMATFHRVAPALTRASRDPSAPAAVAPRPPEINHFCLVGWLLRCRRPGGRKFGTEPALFALQQRELGPAGLSLSLGSRAPALHTAVRGCGSGSSPDFLWPKARNTSWSRLPGRDRIQNPHRPGRQTHT